MVAIVRTTVAVLTAVLTLGAVASCSSDHCDGMQRALASVRLRDVQTQETLCHGSVQCLAPGYDTIQLCDGTSTPAVDGSPDCSCVLWQGAGRPRGFMVVYYEVVARAPGYHDVTTHLWFARGTCGLEGHIDVTLDLEPQ